MGKRIRKGEEKSLGTVITAIILVVFLIIVVMFVLGFFRPNLSKLGDFAESVFPALKSADLFEEEKKAVAAEKTHSELLSEAKSCEDYKKINVQKIKEPERTTLKEEQFECYLEDSACKKAESLILGKNEQKLYKVAKCYLDTHDKINFDRVYLLIKDTTDIALNDLLRTLVTQSAKLDALKRLDVAYLAAIGSLGDEELFTARIVQMESIIQELGPDAKKYNYYVDSAKFFMGRKLSEDGNCDDLSKLGIVAKLFPLEGEYKNEPIESRRLLELGKCYDKISKQIEPVENPYSHLVLNYDFDIPAVREFVNSKKPNCEKISTQTGCESVNSFLSKPGKLNEAYKSLKCTWFEGGWAGLGKDACKSCTEIKSCKDYISKRSCQEDLCVINLGWPCVWDIRVLAIPPYYHCVSDKDEKLY